jgi:serine acetyltransferase
VQKRPTASLWWRLLWEDYQVHYRYKHESRLRSSVLAAPRFLSNASLHANILVRLTIAGPRASARIFRRLLLVSHGCDFSPLAEIGPGLQMTHPLGITVGPRVSIGREVALFHGVTLHAGESGRLVVEDEVQIFTGAYVGGSVTLGRRSVVGANTVVSRGLDPGEVITRGRFLASLA